MRALSLLFSFLSLLPLLLLLTRGCTIFDVAFVVVIVRAFLIGFLMVLVVVVVGGDIGGEAGKTSGSKLVGSSDSKIDIAILRAA